MEADALEILVEQERAAVADAKGKLLRFLPKRSAALTLEERLSVCRDWARPLGAMVYPLGGAVCVEHGQHCALVIEPEEAVLEGEWPAQADRLRALFHGLVWQDTRAVAPDPERAERWQVMLDYRADPDLEVFPVPAPKAQNLVRSSPEYLDFSPPHELAFDPADWVGLSFRDHQEEEDEPDAFPRP